MDTINIVSRFTGAVLYSAAVATLKDAVIQAIKSRANLYGADLSRADLSRANLYGANLARANLYGANLSRADLSRADLSGANLYGANLSRADLSRADLSGANLYGANLSRADLSGADLSRANLYGANLYGANLYGADLSRANLYGAKNAELVCARTSIVPETGPFQGWKKCQGGIIVKIGIPGSAKRSNALGRKCRAERAKVLEIFGAKEAISIHDEKTVYRVGKIVQCDKWDENRWAECSGGIHFFLTRIEAENYA